MTETREISDDMMSDYICAIPFDDYAIKNFIKNNGIKKICYWTGEESTCILMADLIDFIDERIQFEYVEPYCAGAVYNKKETFYEDRFPELLVQSSLEVLNDLLSETPFEILEYISEELSEQYWTAKELYVPSIGEIHAQSWEQFNFIIKHRVRFMFFNESNKINAPSYAEFSDPYTILEEFKNAIFIHDLIIKFDVDDLEVHRARMHKPQKEQLKLEELGPPPEKLAQANRLSPAGITMFYGAFEEETAIIEVLDINRPDYYITTARFSNLKPLKLIDFSSLKWISLFDKGNDEKRKTQILLYQFLADLTKPISSDGSQHIDYIPTQVVTEYLKTLFKSELGEEIHGLIYPSSKRKAHNNIVLFFNNQNITDNSSDKDKYLLLKP